MTPAKSARAADRRPLRVADGSAERFEGFSLLALPLSSGHVLAFRRCVTSSIGPPYTSIWLRDPQERWTFMVDVQPERACPRYFGPALHDVRIGDIDVIWKKRDELVVHARGARLCCTLRLSARPATRAINAVLPIVPPFLWRHDATLRFISERAGAALRAGALPLLGRAPAGHTYRCRPRALWEVRAAAVSINGKDLGAMIALDSPARLHDYTLPSRPLFLMHATEFARITT